MAHGFSPTAAGLFLELTGDNLCRNLLLGQYLPCKILPVPGNSSASQFFLRGISGIMIHVRLSESQLEISLRTLFAEQNAIPAGK